MNFNKIAIVGSGILGMMTAHVLSRYCKEVFLFEDQDNSAIKRKKRRVIRKNILNLIDHLHFLRAIYLNKIYAKKANIKYS